MTRLWLAVLAAAFAVTFLVFPWSDERVTDLFVYAGNAHYFLDGALPYSGVFFEYPPLAAPVLALPGLVGTGYHTYRVAFGLLMLAFAVCVLLLVRALARATGGDERLAMAAVALAPLGTGALIRNHFDLVPVTVTLAALVALLRGRALAAGLLLGVAVAVKGYPIVVLPVALAWLVGRGERRAALEAGIACAAVSAVALTGTIAISPQGAGAALRWQTERPVQVESIAGVAVRALGGAEQVESHRSHGVVHPSAEPLSAGVAAAGVAVVGLLALGAAKRPGPRELVLASLAAVAAFATFGKVLSPQYLVWTLPLAALALAWHARLLFAALAGATVLTFVEFPSRYFDVVDGEPAALTLVACRNLLMIVAVASALWVLLPARLATRPRPSPA